MKLVDDWQPDPAKPFVMAVSGYPTVENCSTREEAEDRARAAARIHLTSAYVFELVSVSTSVAEPAVTRQLRRA